MLDAGKIKKPPAPDPLPMKRRGFGDIHLGTLTQDAAERDAQRQKIYDSWMSGVQENPQKYAKGVHKPAVTEQNLVRPTLATLRPAPDICCWGLRCCD
jgi:hypothetical protein